MKALFINVKDRTITTIDIKGDLQSFYDTIDCEIVEALITYPNGDTLWCDEEANLFPDKIEGGFIFPGWSYPIIGNALITGNDDKGNVIECKYTAAPFTDIVWIDKEEAIKFAKKIIGE